MEVLDATFSAEEFGGDIYQDGSCTRQRVGELNRAAWAAILCDKDGSRQRVRVSGLVPRWLPQKPQAAEHLAVVRLLITDASYGSHLLRRL